MRAADGLPENLYLTTVRLIQSGQNAQQRGFTHAARAEQRDQFTMRQIQRKIL